MTRLTFKSPRAIRQLGRVITALADGPQTRAQLCERLHLSIPMVCDYLAHLMGEPRKVYIKSYLPNSGGRQTPLYALGSGRDAVEPPQKTTTQWRREMRTDQVRHALMLARDRARARADRAAKRPQTPFSALLVGRVATVNAEG